LGFLQLGIEFRNGRVGYNLRLDLVCVQRRVGIRSGRKRTGMHKKGEVRVFKKEGGAKEEIARLGRGELFGEMSLIEDQLTSASVVAETDVDLVVIRRKDFEDLLQKNKDIAFKVYKAFCHTLSDRLRKTSDELFHLMAKSKQKPGKKKSAGKSRKASTKKKAGVKSKATSQKKKK